MRARVLAFTRAVAPDNVRPGARDRRTGARSARPRIGISTGGRMIFEELKEIQRKHGYLPAEELDALSKRTETPLYRIHTVASFYPHFHLAPPATCDVRVCLDMSCHLRGADGLMRDLEARFKGSGEREVSFREVSCLGRCDLAPALS